MNTSSTTRAGGFEDRRPHLEPGTTLTPDPDTFLTLSYGHLNGYNSLSVNGRYAITGRTTLTVSYGSTTGTQLENLQNQLNLRDRAPPTGRWSTVRTAVSCSVATNALPVQSGVFRYDTFTAGLQTVSGPRQFRRQPA